VSNENGHKQDTHSNWKKTPYRVHYTTRTILTTTYNPNHFSQTSYRLLRNGTAPTNIL
jgi:hypothetical protein